MKPITAMAALLTIGLCGSSPTRAEQPAAPVYPFAMCSNGGFFRNNAYPAAMMDCGARMVRVDASLVAARPKPGDNPDAWNWSDLDGMRRVKPDYPQLQFLPILGYCPPWAAEKEGETTRMSARPRGIEIVPANDPRNLYGAYVYETVRRYKDICRDWESWNEPDLPGHGYFLGGGKQFFAIQKTFYLAAKAADPQCTAVFAGMCYGNVEGYLHIHGLKAPSISPPDECFFEDYLKECAKDPQAKANHYYFDVMNQHSYSRASDLYDYVAVDRKLLADYLGDEGKAKPIWITEMGWPDKPGPFGGNEDEYCDYILQSYAWGKLAGVERFFHFQLDNSNGHGLYYQIPKKPKPALTSYRDVLTREFANTASIKQIHGRAGVGFLEGNSAYDPTWRSGYNAFELTTSSGQRRLMAFADTDKEIVVHLPAKAARATLIDRQNQRTPIEAKQGVYTLRLAGATNVAGWPSIDDPKAKALGQPEHLVGGATIVIVENGETPN
ncbi:MAG TPA: hypothetical protein VG326_00075 [Tepidisphaeraceae bacterium]|jgi:hypothetical protein|nr:hypothetical protein [Tepidisphaeraceae bacterium]